MESQDIEIEKWKLKRTIKKLKNLRGNGTSMITLIIPSGGQLHDAQHKMTKEYNTAQNIKDRVNRNSVLEAITSIQQKIKLYNKTPKNGLILFSGNVITEDNKEKRLTLDIEPFIPIKKSIYMCDSAFHTEYLEELLESDKKIGFIIITGSGSLFGYLMGNSKHTLHSFNVDLPKKHGRGGQSAVRFARQRLEARNKYLNDVNEKAVKQFITNDQPNISWLIIGGYADLKDEFYNKNYLDYRLKPIVLRVIDVAYGGENGFNQAIERSADVIGNIKIIQDRKILQQFFEHINQDTGKFCFGISNLIFALESSAVEHLLIWEDIELNRYILQDKNHEETIIYKTEKELENYLAKNNHLEIKDFEPFVDWIADNYKKYGAQLHFISDKTPEGSQFCHGFGGLGAILRYGLEFDTYEEEEELNDENVFIDF